MRLRNKPSMVSAMPEKNAPGSWRSQFTKIIYYLVLLYIVSYAGFHAYQYFTYFRGVGYVEVEKTIISTARGGIISKLNVREGQSLKQGELIAVVKQDDDCNYRIQEKVVELQYQLDQKINQRDLLKNRLRMMTGLPSELEFSVLQKNGELGQMNEYLQSLKNSLGEYELRRALEADEDYRRERERMGREILKLEHQSRLLKTEIRIHEQKIEAENNARLRSQDELQFEIDGLDSEIALAQKHLATMQNRKITGESYNICADENIYSPDNAHVTHVSGKLNEFLEKGEAVTSLILESSAVTIESYIDESELEYLYPEKIVAVKFPDGLETPGRVVKVQSTAYNHPERIWDDYNPVQSEIRLDIVPLNEADGRLWKKYDRIQLKVIGGRYE